MSWLAQASFLRPLPVLIVWATAAVLASVGVARLEFDTSTESVLDRSDEAWFFYRESVDKFGGDEVVVVAFEAEAPYEAEALAAADRVAAMAERLSGVRRVDAITTLPIVRATADGSIDLGPALPPGTPLSSSAAEDAGRAVRDDPVAPRIIASDDGRVIAVNVLLAADTPGDQRAVLEQIRAAAGGTDAWISGVPVFRTEVASRTRTEILTFVPATALILFLLLTVSFRSFSAALAALGSSAVGSLITLGTMGWLSVPVTISTMILPSVLVALGVAYAMHVLNASRAGVTPSQRAAAIGEVAEPVALSGLTTAVGFLALGLIRIEVIRQLGSFGALGVVVLALSALTLVPAILACLPQIRPMGRRQVALVGLLARTAAGISTRAQKATIAAWVIVLVTAAVGLNRLVVETDAVVWFSPDSYVRTSYEQIKHSLAGISPINVVISSEESSPVTSPVVLEKVNALAEYLEALPEVGRAISVADPIQVLHEAFGDSSSAVPNDEQLVEQYLLLLESVEYVSDLVSRDRLAANIVLRVDNNGSEDLVRVAGQAEEWWDHHGIPGFSARSTGIMYEFARSEDELAWGQIRGLVAALGAISVILLAIFRDLRLALLAVVPNFVPLVVVFGVMGGLGLPLDAVTVGLGSMALGIAVDDTVHIVSVYARGREKGFSGRQSLEGALRRVSAPVIYTTLAIAAGFLVLGLSNFLVTQHLGYVTAGMVALCLFADLTLLPSILIVEGTLATRRADAKEASG